MGFCKNIPLRSTGYNNPDALVGSFEQEAPHQTMHEVLSLSQPPPSALRNNDEVLYRLVSPSWSQSSRIYRLTRSLKITSIHTVSANDFNRTVIALTSLYQHKRQNRAVEAPLPWIKYKLSFRKVMVALVLWKAQPHSVLLRRMSTFS